MGCLLTSLQAPCKSLEYKTDLCCKIAALSWESCDSMAMKPGSLMSASQLSERSPTTMVPAGLVARMAASMSGFSLTLAAPWHTTFHSDEEYSDSCSDRSCLRGGCLPTASWASRRAPPSLPSCSRGGCLCTASSLKCVLPPASSCSCRGCLSTASPALTTSRSSLLSLPTLACSSLLSTPCTPIVLMLTSLTSTLLASLFSRLRNLPDLGCDWWEFPPTVPASTATTAARPTSPSTRGARYASRVCTRGGLSSSAGSGSRATVPALPAGSNGGNHRTTISLGPVPVQPAGRGAQGVLAARA
mmetsp:Transcript_75143/g.223978  ORF Transcript_75143/g.223978 Transcript_75143/m.223978 type:complete len:302 (+) Transcript_75143:778-1683(+)